MGTSKGIEVERRVAPRQQATYRLDVLFPDRSAGFLLDVSSSGLRLRFKQGLDVEGTRSLQIVFPRWLELGEGLEVSGRFVWIRASQSGGAEAGFAFDGLTRKDENVLSVLIQRLAAALEEDVGGAGAAA